MADAMRDAGAIAYPAKSGPFEDLIAAVRNCASDARDDPN